MLATVVALGLGAAVAGARAGGVKPVTTGAVVRGLTPKDSAGHVLPAGMRGTKVGTNCDSLATEDVDSAGRLEDASVQCADGQSEAQGVAALPARFTAYCVTDAKYLRSARLIPAPVAGNPTHCSLSAIKAKDAVATFGGAKWK